MTDITPPPELAAIWVAEIYGNGDPAIPLRPITLRLVERAAQWGADQELEACCEWLDNVGDLKQQLRTARRPKPPSLKEQALETLRSMQIEPCWIDGINTNAELMSKYDTIRRAINQLPDD